MIMNDDEIIDNLLLRIPSDNAVMFWGIYKQVNKTDSDVKIESILNEMLKVGLIRKDPMGNDDMPVVALTKLGFDVKQQGGWIVHRINQMSDGHKIHEL